MKKVTVKHLTKEEMAKCNALLNSVGNVNSCIYQAIEKKVFEFVNAKEAFLIAQKRLFEFANNDSLKAQLAERLERATTRFANSQI